MPFTLTVTNTGSVAATRVQVTDVPPAAALALVELKSGSRARVVRGNAIWRLGTLAPGATRTVRGSVRIKAGIPGLKRNLVLATAVNAQLASDRADIRSRSRRSRPSRAKRPSSLTGRPGCETGHGKPGHPVGPGYNRKAAGSVAGDDGAGHLDRTLPAVAREHNEAAVPLAAGTLVAVGERSTQPAEPDVVGGTCVGRDGGRVEVDRVVPA